MVKTSSVGMLALQVMPFFAVDAPPSHSWPSASPIVRSTPGAEYCSAWKRWPLSHSVRSRSRALWASQFATAPSLSTREAEKIAFCRQLKRAHRYPVLQSANEISFQ